MGIHIPHLVSIAHYFKFDDQKYLAIVPKVEEKVMHA